MIFQRKNIHQVLVHIFLWLAIYGLLLYPFIALSQSIPIALILKTATATVLFYLNYFYLVPLFLLNNKKALYIIISSILLIIIIYTMHSMLPPFGPMHPPGPHSQELLAFHFPVIPVINFAVPFLFSTMLRVYFEWQENENQRKLNEKEKVQSELQFLKAQLNPHFLFNSLNSIYSLSVKKSSDTPEAIINLSELMRYMLYEADRDLVPLNKEIEYIKNYVTLQRLRLADGENISLKISGEETNKNVPPLLFISFIENAFKYGTDYKGKTMVKIDFTLTENSLHFKVVNSMGAYKAKSESSGLGLENIKNRLKYLYPNSHTLDINQDGTTYEVNLSLNL